MELPTIADRFERLSDPVQRKVFVDAAKRVGFRVDPALLHPMGIPLLGDAGAHVGQLMDADSPTFLLSELTRDRGVFTLPEARPPSHGQVGPGARARGAWRDS